MNFYDDVKDWYGFGLWTKEMVANAVVRGKISKDEYESITGEDYAV